MQRKRRDRDHALRSGRRRWGENGETRPITADQVPVLRGAQRQMRSEQPRWRRRLYHGGIVRTFLLWPKPPRHWLVGTLSPAGRQKTKRFFVDTQ